MTKKERTEIRRYLRTLYAPSVTTAHYNEEEGYKEVTSHAEANRLLDSSDFKAGWAGCFNRVREVLALYGIDLPTEYERDT